jgi:hypothetical protein
MHHVSRIAHHESVLERGETVTVGVAGDAVGEGLVAVGVTVGWVVGVAVGVEVGGGVVGVAVGGTAVVVGVGVGVGSVIASTTSLLICARVALLPGRKYDRPWGSHGSKGPPQG